jgi:tRNA(fMet)-specific endonuclease VapC
MILDSSVIIDYLRGRAPAMTFVASLGSTGALRTHALVVGEVLVGARNRSEQDDIDRFFSGFVVEPIEASDCAVAIELLRQFRLSHNLSLPDAFIAATCLRLSLPVATLNDKHFAMISSLAVVRPY